MIFLAKASIVILVLLAFYKLLLERESFFAVNRIYLMVTLLLVFTLPFISLPKMVEHQGIVNGWLEWTTYQKPTQTDFEATELETKISETERTQTLGKSNPVAPSASRDYSFAFWLFWIYIFGVVILSAHLIFQIIGIYLTVRKTDDRVVDLEYALLNVKDDSGPRSFFKYIFINPEKYDSETFEHILEHEKIHVAQKHSIDLLLSEIAIIVLWFNPFVWLFRKEVEKNIEYQTDALLLESSLVEPQNYQMNLLEIGVERKPLTIVSNYNQSLIKKRIVMMNKKKSNGHSYWKYAFIAPTLMVTLLLLNQPFSIHAQYQVGKTYVNEDGEYENDNENDRSPLLQAAWTGDYDLVKKLVSEGADINQLQEGEGTALVLAIRQEEFKIAKFLLEKGADPNLGTGSDGHPLWLAAEKGDIELVRLLVKQGADVNTKFHGDGSTLIQACKMGNLEMAKVLVELKADVNMEVQGDGNPLIMAAKGGYLEIVDYLVELGAKVNNEVPGDETPLINASEQGHLNVVKFLVEKGADVNKVCTELYNGKTRVRTALKMAEKKGHNSVVQYLKSKGAKN
jgi:ankyrin repeat protein